MRFFADVQIHSRYSRATSKHADIEHNALWARKKGIAVVGTGDFTHPAWRAEIKQKLVQAEPGLFQLNPTYQQWVDERMPKACMGPVRFMLQVEISTIYKKFDKVRKVHHLIFVPDFNAMDKLSTSLAKIGNLASDGRPILGLDSRDLLEITLESDAHSYLIPAHIWTPWFAALGSKSGFDSIAECYGDLAEHIFAVETGLSSDPPMNWRVSSLDQYRLVSNSDAHSPPKIGREATVYDTALNYFAMLNALKTGDGFVGTVEFFPEEGKYHMDGHRKCNVCLTPEETLELQGQCPVCGGAITVGVLHRVNALADRPAENLMPPPKAGQTFSFVPLPEILSEITGKGVNTQTVSQYYERLLGALGPEMDILDKIPITDIQKADSDILAEAIKRLRAGQVIRTSGYDGEYGVIKLFEAEELAQNRSGELLFALPDQPTHSEQPAKPIAGKTIGTSDKSPNQTLLKENTNAAHQLDTAQQQAIEITHGPLLIMAGPGSGKTRVLTERIAHLIQYHNVKTENCLAITFTRRAATEMKERLQGMLGDKAKRIPIHTFHSLGLNILRQHADTLNLPADFVIANAAQQEELLRQIMDCSPRQARRLLRNISKAKRTNLCETEETRGALKAYTQALRQRSWVDFDDLIGLTHQLLEAYPAILQICQQQLQFISVDEFQDVDPKQYALLKLLSAQNQNLCVIGDPNQAIYSFRGADADVFGHFATDYPAARTIRLERNYRSTGTIVSAADQVIGAERKLQKLVRDMAEHIILHAAATPDAEAEFIVKTIEELMGGHSFFSIDSGRGQPGAQHNYSFADIAVLYRADAQSAPLLKAFARAGMPVKKHGHNRLIDNPSIQDILAHLPHNIADQNLTEAVRSAVQSAKNNATTISEYEFDHAQQNLFNLANSVGQIHEKFMELLPLTSEADTRDPRADAISLLTLHAAKGLEFPAVFIIGIEDGLIPLKWGDTIDEDTLAEERRLFYVGMTRAQDRLFLSHAKKRLVHGKLVERAPSPFLKVITEELLAHSQHKAKRKPAISQQLSLFEN